MSKEKKTTFMKIFTIQKDIYVIIVSEKTQAKLDTIKYMIIVTTIFKCTEKRFNFDVSSDCFFLAGRIIGEFCFFSFSIFSKFSTIFYS